MVTPESIKQSIVAGLACEHVEVAGDGTHWEALVVSPAFVGLSRIKQHQLVYAALGELMGGEIHALSIEALTPEEAGTAGSR